MPVPWQRMSKSVPNADEGGSIRGLHHAGLAFGAVSPFEGGLTLCLSRTKQSIISGPERNQDGRADAPPNGAGPSLMEFRAAPREGGLEAYFSGLLIVVNFSFRLE